jgi:hypothetical protein
MNTTFTDVYEKYKGLWVALTEPLNEVISADKSPKKAFEDAVNKGYKNPTLFKVPLENMPYIG